MASYAHYPSAQTAYAPPYDRAPPYNPSSPRYSMYASAGTPSPRGSAKINHARRASHAPPGFGSASRVPPNLYPEYHYATPSPRDRRQTTFVPGTSRREEYVSAFNSTRGPTRSYRAPAYGTQHHRSSSTKYAQREKVDPRRRYSHWHYVFVDDGYDYRDAPPPYTTTYEFFDGYGGTDHDYYYGQAPAYEPVQAEPTPLKANQSRPRRASQATRPSPTPPKKPVKTEKTVRKATAEDAARAGIPAGYSYKNWDPSEEPITLLGSVFDANSLGKWIYDWTVYSHGPATPLSDMAGDLWLLLIQLAGKIKRADETIDKVRQEENRELVEDFLESGERLWVRLKKLLKICEEYMWQAAKDDNGGKKPVTMGKNSGCEFVDSIFGRDRELDKTEKLMSAIRLWSMRFDANCDEILRNPTL
ncbi:uncharacterized protein PV09_02330 [Verruconis gallopava]|uniref:Vegetative cell wall protein gp1 n=1 Tax=Verruconis gallopava TaxID=253628 RepID=A0A0D1XV12_9PEZI|nr:uncharacterized protein PV09_02330 [Verruconis gallopava]KIW06616.1 hypothetical protein PV09_02330 [Verruconis gallopava]